MKEALLSKLGLPDVRYSQAELAWLVAHIGDSSSEIRDQLVYASFCQAILGEGLGRNQLEWLLATILEKKLLFYQIEQKGQASLTRSFTALLWALIIDVDGQEESLYYKILSCEQRERVFRESLLYLEKEEDLRGYDDSCGWIHAIAHAADLILYVSRHPAFPVTAYESIWQVCLAKLRHLPSPFVAGEDSCLARIFQNLLAQGKLAPITLLEWLKEVDLSAHDDQSYLTKLPVYQFLIVLFVQLKGLDLLSSREENVFLSKLAEFQI